MGFAEASSNHSVVITAAIALMIVMGPCQVRMRSLLHFVRCTGLSEPSCEGQTGGQIRKLCGKEEGGGKRSWMGGFSWTAIGSATVGFQWKVGGLPNGLVRTCSDGTRIKPCLSAAGHIDAVWLTAHNASLGTISGTNLENCMDGCLGSKT